MRYLKIFILISCCNIPIQSFGQQQWYAVWGYDRTEDLRNVFFLQGIYKGKIEKSEIHNIPAIKSDGWWLIGFADDSLKLISYTSAIKSDTSPRFVLIDYLEHVGLSWGNTSILPNGRWLEYYKKGNKSFTQIEINKINDLEGNLFIYNMNKSLSSYTSFKNGDEYGFFNNFYENGNIKAMGFNYEGGFADFMAFYENQHPFWQQSILNHYVKRWAENDTLTFYTQINDSLIFHGFSKSWYNNGKMQFQGQYNNGKKIGEWIEYNKKGQIVKKEYYVNGELKK